MRKELPVIAFTALIWSVFACHLDYEAARIPEDITAETPDTILNNFTHTIVSAGKVSVIVTADKAETFGQKKQVVIHNVHFREFDEDGGLLIEGRTDRASYSTDTEDASLSGSISIYSAVDETEILAENLYWTSAGKILEADPEEWILVRKDDGSYVEGRGFMVDFSRKRLQFASGVRGQYEWEEDE